jgi:hypothetical protein
MGDTIVYLKAWQCGREFKGNRTDTDFCKFAEWYHQKREQERQGPAPDRDEIAMSMPDAMLPIILNAAALCELCENLGIKYNKKMPGWDIWAQIEVNARVRYMYADAMLKARKIN